MPRIGLKRRENQFFSGGNRTRINGLARSAVQAKEMSRRGRHACLNDVQLCSDFASTFCCESYNEQCFVVQYFRCLNHSKKRPTSCLGARLNINTSGNIFKVFRCEGTIHLIMRFLHLERM